METKDKTKKAIKKNKDKTVDFSLKVERLYKEYTKRNKLTNDGLLQAFEANIYSVLLEQYNAKKIDNNEVLALLNKSHNRLSNTIKYRMGMRHFLESGEVLTDEKWRT